MKLLIAALMLGMTFVGVSCSDEYNYPDVLTEFVDIHTSAEGVIDELHTDAGDKYAVKFREGLGGLVADSIYRSVSVYQLLPEEEGDTAVKLYSSLLIMAYKPVVADAFQEGIKTDAVDVQSIWRAGKYLNMVLLPKVKEEKHAFHFIEEGITVEEGVRTLNLRLYHDRGNDFEAFTEKVYLSVPLWAYADDLKEGDKVRFTVNTYKDGERSWVFPY